MNWFSVFILRLGVESEFNQMSLFTFLYISLSDIYDLLGQLKKNSSVTCLIFWKNFWIRQYACWFSYLHKSSEKTWFNIGGHKYSLHQVFVILDYYFYISIRFLLQNFHWNSAFYFFKQYICFTRKVNIKKTTQV